jgi:hypothetical protein
VAEEQLLAIQFHPVRDSDMADVPSGPRGLDGLHHRLLLVTLSPLGKSILVIDVAVAQMSRDINSGSVSSQWRRLALPNFLYLLFLYLLQ